MMNIVALDFKTRMPEAALFQFAANISKHMIDDPAFASLKEDALLLQEKSEVFSAAFQAAADGSRTKIAEKRKVKEELLNLLEKMSYNVNILANGDESVILQSGFTVRRKSVQRRDGDLTQVTRLQGRTGNHPGEVILEFDAVPNALIYAAEWSADNGQTWHNGIYPSSRRALIQGLPTRTDILFRVCAIGSGQRKGQHSDPVRLFVA